MISYQESGVGISAVSVAVLFVVTIKTIGLLWLIFGIRETQYTLNIPYQSVALYMIAVLILFGIAFQKKYYIHLTLYLIQFLLIIYILMTKLDLEGHL